MIHRAIFGALVFSLALSSAGCMRVVHASTDRLTVPTPDAPFRERRDAFVASRPEGLDTTHVIYNDRLFGRHQVWVNSVTLADATTIYSPDVLLDAVDPMSRTAEAISRYDDYRRRTNRRLWISRGLLMGAGAALVTGLALREDSRADNALLATGGGLFLGWAGTRFALRRSIRNRDRAEYEAYLAYDADLADHLDVCTNGEAVVECR